MRRFPVRRAANTLAVRAAGFLLLAAVWTPAKSFGWGTAGHQQVCALAWDELQPAAARNVRERLGVSQRNEFAALCNHGEARPADLLSLPAGAREVDLGRDCPALRSCPVLEIERALELIETRSGELGPAILGLAHYTAELHMPLSVGYAADQNGRGLQATFIGRPTTMYDIWAEHLVHAPRPPRPLLDTGFELRLITNFLERPRWTATSPLDWAIESYWIMRTPATGYVGNPGGLAFDELYIAQNKVTVLDQLEKAGVRLAHLLNRAFGDPGASVPEPVPQGVP